MSKPLELVLIGAGSRGMRAYAPYAFDHPEEVRFVAVAEPDEERRRTFADEHDIDDSRTFSSWEELLRRGQMGQGALVTTQDQMHVEPAVAAMQAGYDVLLEKPMAHTLAGCVKLVQTAEQTGRTLQICHVLRYSPFWVTLKGVLDSGILGKIMTVEHRENVAYWHMAHSFVRGNWGNTAKSSPMILAKCCHDLDILYWNLPGHCERLSSFGSLLHYRPETVGPEIPLRCTDGCPIEQECAFSAPGIYLDYRPFAQMRADAAAGDLDLQRPMTWPFLTLTNDPTVENRLEALRTGPYGRCVYHCDNDVVDHQVVSMEWTGGASVVLVMHGHSDEEHRSMRYDGAKATLRARFGRQSQISVHHHGGPIEEIPIPDAGSGHGGGDAGIMADFVQVLRGDRAALTKRARVAGKPSDGLRRGRSADERPGHHHGRLSPGCGRYGYTLTIAQGPHSARRLRSFIQPIWRSIRLSFKDETGLKRPPTGQRQSHWRKPASSNRQQATKKQILRSKKLIAAAVSVAGGKAITDTWRKQFRWLINQYAAGALIGLFAAIAYVERGAAFGVVTFALPVFMMYFAQKQYVSHTRESVQELQRMNRQLAQANFEVETAAEAIRELNSGLFVTLATVLDARDRYARNFSMAGS